MSGQDDNTKGFIPSHGGYRNLFSYQKAEIIYDGTVLSLISFEVLMKSFYIAPMNLLSILK
ncbi:hypothetical protein [Lunatibacter salilacus]|uniref:hypothetical protein n=1 Tax=Lunatibacter salilacus TaxID=2483804 RepID=UPI0018FE0C41|nr:hypothetical protein [Lunatibacter salilacus]